jgi:uncharacterized protein YggE
MRRTLLPALLIVAATAVPAAAQQAMPNQPLISTQGQATKKVSPDLAWLTVSAESRAPRTADAQKQNAVAIDGVRSSLKQAGVPDEAVKTRSYSVEPQMQYTDGKSKVIGYIARQALEVRVDDLGRLGAIIDAAGGAGATSISDIRYDVKDRASIEAMLVGAAVRDGINRANAMAAGAGRTAGPVWRIDEQRVFDGSPRPMYAAMAGKMDAATSISPDDLELRAQVSITVILK